MKATIQKAAFITLSLGAFLLFEARFTQAIACDYYASPSGRGNGLSQGSPFQIADFWPVAAPGKTLCLLDGVYTDSRSMINPPENLNGTATQKVTVRTLNDGTVRVNGGGTKIPVRLRNNDHFILEGFDAHNSSGDTVLLDRGADNNIVRRVCAWNANTNANNHVWAHNYGAGSVFEDICGFGTGRYIFAHFTSQGVTVRRGWFMWNAHALFGNSSGSPKAAVNLVYDGYNGTFENLIGTWDGAATGAYGVFTPTGTNSTGGTTNYCFNGKLLGSIAYVRNGQTVPSLIGKTYGSRSVDCFEYKDDVFFVGSNFASLKPIFASGFDGGDSSNPINCPVCNRRLTNITEIGGTASAIGTGSNGWTVTNRIDVDTIAQMDSARANPFQASGGSGARVCKRYENGVLTKTPLWPWPMDARIRAALTTAGKNPDAIFGGTGNSVTQLMESIFGTIPAECRTQSSSTVSVPIAPSGLRVRP